MKKNIMKLLVPIAMSAALAGCGKVAATEAGTGSTVSVSANVIESVSNDETVITSETAAKDNESAQKDNTKGTAASEQVTAERISSDEGTETDPIVNGETGNVPDGDSDSIRNYAGVEDLLSDADCLVKGEVLDAETSNVRSYIYTSYTIEVLDTLYGEVKESQSSLANGIRNPVLTVNLPGGTLEGDAAAAMQKEVTDGKDAGRLPDIDSISSDGNTDRLLEKGDIAYFFLVQESEDAYAVVGEYEGVAFVEGNEVILNADISDTDQELQENDFVSIIQKITRR